MTGFGKHGRLLLGLTGFPLDHSFSPDWFREKFQREGIRNAEYRLFPLPVAEDILPLIRSEPDLAGLNVTLPHKERLLPCLDALDPVAAEIGAVNVIHISRSRAGIRTTGYNTDGPAFLQTLNELNAAGPALLLGGGGAARAVAWALSAAKIPFLAAGRTPSGFCRIPFDAITPQMVRQYPLIIQATPVGMYPDTMHTLPLPWNALSDRHTLYDLVYNPGETKFLQKGREAGARTFNGLKMLHLQAELSWEIFTGMASPR